MSRIGMLTFPAIRSDGKNFVSNIKRNTKHSRVRQKHSTRAPAGLPGVEHQTQNAARNHVHRVHRPTMSNQKLKSLTSHKATETNQVQRRPPQSHGILRFHEKENTKKKTSTTCATKLKMLQSKLLDRSLCFSIVHIAKQTAQACILRFPCELIQSCKATLQSSPKFFLWHLFLVSACSVACTQFCAALASLLKLLGGNPQRGTHEFCFQLMGSSQ